MLNLVLFLGGFVVLSPFVLRLHSGNASQPCFHYKLQRVVFSLVMLQIFGSEDLSS